jgi:hypothetical protein
MTRILFLAANPKDTPSQRLDEEIRTIEERILLADLRDLFDVKCESAVRTSDIHRALLQHEPHIVHFAGLGTSSGEILLEDKFGNSSPVSTEVLAHLFSILKGNVCCVLINARYAELQAQAIATHVGCVISMSNLVSDGAAICFAAAFYQALGFGRTIKTAFDLGCNQLALEGLGKDATPVLLPDREAADISVTDSRRMSLLASMILLKLNQGGSNERAETARQLGYLKDAAAIPILEMRWPSEADFSVRYWLAIAIGWICGPRAIEALLRLKQVETEPWVQSGIDEALDYCSRHQLG